MENNPLPEEQQAAALRTVARIGAQRAALLAQAEELVPSLREAAVAADATGAQRARISALAQISPNTLTAWLRDAGADVRPKRTAKTTPGHRSGGTRGGHRSGGTRG
ncbi:hypothetical protein ACIQI7_38585 [Kitasatospora sp. NPDC092039]|uniref:hypothetical protein n=1 Tax=Kitasatospora sp. NPDC092039 TaxID=3364086 RepID=UPI0038281D24